MTHSSSGTHAADQNHSSPEDDLPLPMDKGVSTEELEEGTVVTTVSQNGDASTTVSSLLADTLAAETADANLNTVDSSPAVAPVTSPHLAESLPQLGSQEKSVDTIQHWHQSAEAPFKAKVMSWALALSMLPVLAVGTITYLSGQSVQQQITQTRQSGIRELSTTERSIQQQLPTLLIGTGLTAILAGAIAAWLAHRATKPVLKAVQVSNQMLSRISPGMVHKDETGQDALNQLERNVRTIEDYLPALLEQQDTEIEQLQMLKHVTNKICTSLNEDDVLHTTVTEARKILKADRVIVYGFDEDWYGTVIAESVVPGLSKALWAEIRDPCFAEHYVDKYREGRIQAIDNIYEAGLTKCHLAQLEPFQVKANLVVPILREQNLFGLLIAHQCSQPRVWQKREINFFAQVASQVGFALDHARLLVQVDQASQITTAHSQQAVQDYEVLQQRIAQLSAESNGVVELLGTDANIAITKTQDQIHEIAEVADRIQLILNEMSQTQQQAQTTTQESQTIMMDTVHHLERLSQLVETVDQSVRPLQQPTQQLSELINVMGHVISQVQLQAMNAALEAARVGSAGQSFAEIAEKVHGLSRQLDATLTDVKPLISHIQTTAKTVVTDMTTGKDTITADTQLLDNTQIKLKALDVLHQRVCDLIQQIAGMTTHQVELSVSGQKTLENLASTTLNATEQSAQLVETVDQLIIPTNVASSTEDNHST